MSDLWILCPHGEAKRHSRRHWPNSADEPEYEDCPGGHPVEGGEKVWWCDVHDSAKSSRGPDECQAYFLGLQGLIAIDWTLCRMVERFLIPLSNTEGEK